MTFKIATSLPDVKINQKKINDSHSLEKFLIDSYWITALPNDALSNLKRRKPTLKELLIFDLFYDLNGKNSLESIPRGAREYTEYFCEQFTNASNYFPKNGGKTHSLNSLKLLAAAKYLSLIENDSSKELLKTAKSQREYKGILLYDYIFEKLSPTRQESAQQPNTLKDSLERIVSLNIFQNAEGFLKEETNEVEEFQKILKDKKSISLDDLKKYKKIKEKILQDKECPFDEEFSKELKQYHSKIQELQYKINEKIGEKTQKLREECNEISEDLKKINEKDKFSSEDINKLDKMTSKLNYIPKLLQEAEVDDEITFGFASQLKKRVKPIKERYNEYIQHEKWLKNTNQIFNEITQAHEDSLIVLDFKDYMEKLKFLSKSLKSCKNLKKNKLLERLTDNYTSHAEAFYKKAKTDLGSLEERIKTKTRNLETKLRESKGFWKKIAKNPNYKRQIKANQNILVEIQEVYNLLFD